MDKTFKIIYAAFYVAIIAIIVFLLFALFPVKGNYQIKIVKSGSMEPSIHTGSIVVIKPSQSYVTGDVVTFGKDTKTDIPTTHRIVSSRAVDGVIMFATKGDANENDDPSEIRQSAIHGKVIFDVPFLGYIIDIARKPWGFAILIILPALIVIYDEGAKIFRELDRMKKKKSAPLLALALLWAGLLGVGSTNSYYNDNEGSSGNAFIAGAVDFTITNGDLAPREASLNLQPGTTTGKTVGMALESDSDPIKYRVSASDIAGDLDLCQAVDLIAKLGGMDQFSGKLTDFASPATTTLGDWRYDLSLPNDAALYNKTCSFAFEYDGRQTAPHHESSSGGYHDIEGATSTISSWGFRINKAYHDVDPAHGIEGENEWVEIYNQTDAGLDISGWQICDASSCDAIPASAIIPAKGFAVITASSTTWEYWDVPGSVVRIELGQDIGDGLANEGDSLILKRPDGIVIDQMSWNAGLPEGHMLGRKPNGYDTDQSGDFVDMALPTVILTSPDQSGSLTWYWTYHYPINWTATNPNGPASAIRINLSYIVDSDHTGTITPSDPVVTIADGLPNSGSRSWRVPSGFIGYIWIKIVAVGPENVMLNSAMVSGKIYDPFPEDMWNDQREMIIDGLRAAGLIAPDHTPASLAEVEEILARASGEGAQTAEPMATTTVDIATTTMDIATTTATDIATTTIDTATTTMDDIATTTDIGSGTSEMTDDTDTASTSDMISAEIPSAEPDPIPVVEQADDPLPEPEPEAIIEITPATEPPPADNAPAPDPVPPPAVVPESEPI